MDGLPDVRTGDGHAKRNFILLYDYKFNKKIHYLPEKSEDVQTLEPDCAVCPVCSHGAVRIPGLLRHQHQWRPGPLRHQQLILHPLASFPNMCGGCLRSNLRKNK